MPLPVPKHHLKALAVTARRPRTAVLRTYATSATDKNKETIVVIGGGWAGYNFVRKLDKVS